MHSPLFSPHRPVSPEPLRLYLARSITEDDLKYIAAADYGAGKADNFDFFTHNLATGFYTFPPHWKPNYDPEGNCYECCLLMFHNDKLIRRLFGAWWIGAFCSGDKNAWILIDNLYVPSGIQYLLANVEIACESLGSKAAHAALPFVAFLHSRDPHPDDDMYRDFVRRLAAIESKPEEA